MSYNLSTIIKEDVIVATVTGQRTLNNVVAVATEILNQAIEQEIKKALVDVRTFEGALSTLDAFSLVTIHFQTLRKFRYVRQVAILDEYFTEERHRFLQNTARNRGYNLKIFDNMEKAWEWLRQSANL